MTDLEHPAGITSAAAGTWDVALCAALPQGWRREQLETRFEQPELRLWRGEDWAVSAVLHPEWVLFYLRRPFFRGSALDAQTVAARFPAARIDNGAVKLRINDAAEAKALCAICLPVD